MHIQQFYGDDTAKPIFCAKWVNNFLGEFSNLALTSVLPHHFFPAGSFAF
jgi:hypothetical protein